MCDKKFHQKCMRMSKKSFNAINRDTFVCSKKCEFTEFPFHCVSDRQFRIINKKINRFPCQACSGECHKKMERVKCGGCSRWLHLECSKLSKNQFNDYLTNTEDNVFRCSPKCELKLLPFNNLDEFDFTKDVGNGKVQYVNRNVKSKMYRSRRKKKLKENEISTSQSLCEYLEPGEVTEFMNDGCLSDLTVFHSNVRSLKKNLDKVKEVFENGKKLPDVIGVTETKFKDIPNETDIEGCSF